MEAMAIIVTLCGLRNHYGGDSIHFFNSCSTNIVDHEGSFDEPSAVGKVHVVWWWWLWKLHFLEFRWFRYVIITLGHWIRPWHWKHQLRDLQKIDRDAFRIWRALCQTLRLDFTTETGHKFHVTGQRKHEKDRLKVCYISWCPKCVSQSDMYYDLSTWL